MKTLQIFDAERERVVFINTNEVESASLPTRQFDETASMRQVLHVIFKSGRETLITINPHFYPESLRIIEEAFK